MLLYVLCALAVLCQLVAVSYNSWTEIEDTKNSGNKGRIGLWEMCMKAEGASESCLKLKDNPQLPKKELDTVRVCAILSLLLLVCVLICSYVWPHHKLCQQVCLIMSALLGVVAVIVWNDKFVTKGDPDTNEKLGVCAYLDILAVFLALGAAFVLYQEK